MKLKDEFNFILATDEEHLADPPLYKATRNPELTKLSAVNDGSDPFEITMPSDSTFRMIMGAKVLETKLKKNEIIRVLVEEKPAAVKEEEAVSVVSIFTALNDLSKRSDILTEDDGKFLIERLTVGAQLLEAYVEMDVQLRRDYGIEEVIDPSLRKATNGFLMVEEWEG